MKNNISHAAAKLGCMKTQKKADAARENGAKGGRPGMYSVMINSGNAPAFCHEAGISRISAKTLAVTLSGKGMKGIYVEFFRPSDGQRGYLNPDGNHAITGECWDSE